MTDRAAAPTERATACPFVAFEDDRDERSDRPDHRHRCFAESRPAPRAIAHQEAFCLSPAFAGCPTFQDWARREAAHTSTVRSAPTATRVEAAEIAAAEVDAVPDRPESDEAPLDDESDYGRAPAADERARSSSRDWAAPPPWAVDASAVAGTAGGSSDRSESSSGSTSSGTAAKAVGVGAGLAASRWLADGSTDAGDSDYAESGSPAGTTGHDAGATSTTAGVAPDDELAGLVSRSRPASSRARTTSKASAGQAKAAQAKAGRRPPSEDGGPSWERPKRFEAYPTLRTRVGFPAVPRIILALAGLALAAFIVFMVPSLFFSGGDQGTGGQATPSPSSIGSASVAPTPIPAATPLTYTVKAGDNLGKIAKKFGVTQKEILTANPKIKDANKIAVGQVIIIPAAATSPTEIIDSGPTSPSPAPSSAAP